MLGMLETNRRHDHQAAQYLLHILENKGGSAGSPFSIGHPAVAMPLWATQ